MRDVLYDDAERRDDATLLCDWCHEPSDTDICATCQRRYEEETEADWQAVLDDAPDATRQAEIARLLALYHQKNCSRQEGCSCDMAEEELQATPDVGLMMLRPYYERPVYARPTTQSLVDVVRAVTRQRKLGRV